MKKTYFYLLLSVFFLTGIHTAHAQILKKAAKSSVGLLTSLDLTGTWDYEGTSVQFQSTNLLKKAGGKAAASQLEKNLNDQLDKLGFEPGVTTFTFAEDGTFSNTTNGKTLSGKYTYDKSTKYITLKYLNHIPLKAKVSGSGDKISFLFEADSFLSMVTFLGSHSGVGVLKGVSSLLKSYDGMMAGMELKKQ